MIYENDVENKKLNSVEISSLNEIYCISIFFHILLGRDF